MWTVADTVHHACHNGSQRKSTGDQKDRAGTAPCFTGHFVSDEESETKTGGGLGQAYRPADGKIFGKFVKGKLCHNSHHYSSPARQATGNRQKRAT